MKNGKEKLENGIKWPKIVKNVKISPHNLVWDTR